MNSDIRKVNGIGEVTFLYSILPGVFAHNKDDLEEEIGDHMKMWRFSDVHVTVSHTEEDDSMPLVTIRSQRFGLPE